MVKTKTKSPPLWMQTLEPKNYALAWFAKSGFAKKVKTKTKGKTKKSELLPIAKKLLAEGRGMLEKRFFKDNDGAFYVGGYVWVMDCLIEALFENLIGKEPQGLSLVATGGYGRGELAPSSDIDLLFLTKNAADKKTRAQIEAMLYMLWDMGLTVGYATRSITQALKATKEDMTIRTALLEARHLAGDEALFKQLMEKFDRTIVANSEVEFITHKLEERDARHGRGDNRRYALEPNIKEGKGGLRDLHTLFWIARYAYKVSSIDAMIGHGVLSRSEAQVFSSAQRFLWSVRCHLHLRAGREDDRLTFDAQMDIAPLLGFKSKSGLSEVECFMQRYYLEAKAVGNLTRIFCAAFAADFASPSLRPFLERLLPKRVPKPFEILSGRLSLPDDVDFAKAPQLMMKMFGVAQEMKLDIHPNALRKLHSNLSLVDKRFRNDAENNKEFLRLLTSTHSCERILRLMNESGFIGKFIPDFGRIVAMMQFDMYHSYTVDEHTIFAMGVLNGIATGELAEIAPVATRVAKEITLWRELCVALLLHDIAKGRGGDHSVLGAKVAREICPRFKMTEAETETVAWLVGHHLLMSETAFRYDLNDPATIIGFVDKVQSPERLNLLLVLTVADIRAVGPNVWNGWKAALIRSLYARAMAVLRGENVTDEISHVENEAKVRLTDALKGDWNKEATNQYTDEFYSSYWTAFSPASHLRHAEMFSRHLKEKKPFSITLTPDAPRNATELVIITPDDARLFSRIAGGVAAMGANIVDARTTTRKDGLTLNALWIQDQNKQAISEAKELETIRSGVEKAVIGTMDIASATERRGRQTPSRIRQIKAPARVILNNEISTTHTVIEINGKDAPRLLYKLTDRMTSLGLRIQMASVSTYGDRVVDVFYVKDGFGLKVTSTARIEKIRHSLLEVLRLSDPANKVVA